MTTTANILPTAETDGVAYATAVPVTPTEASLGDGIATPPIFPVVEGQTIIAVVKLWGSGHLTANNTFVFLQTDLGDGVWVDVAWCRFTDTDTPVGNPSVFVLSGGGIGAMNNSFGPLRKQNSAPAAQANGSNQIPLGGRCRFTGFGLIAGGSSSSLGLGTGNPVCTITYKLQHPR